MDMEDFYSSLNSKALDDFKRLDNTDKVHTENRKLSVGSLEAHVVRGSVLAKAATARIQLKTPNPLIGEDTQFNIFQIKVYPANPHTPILLCNIENRVAGEDRFNGFLDVAPVAAAHQDLESMQTIIKDICEKHGETYEVLCGQVKDIYKMDHWDRALNAGIGIRLELPQQQFELVAEAAQAWLESYIAIAAKRANAPFDARAGALMYDVRARIMEFYMLKDMSFTVIQKLGAPLELMGLIHFAPVVQY